MGRWLARSLRRWADRLDPAGEDRPGLQLSFTAPASSPPRPSWHAASHLSRPGECGDRGELLLATRCVLPFRHGGPCQYEPVTTKGESEHRE